MYHCYSPADLLMAEIFVGKQKYSSWHVETEERSNKKVTVRLPKYLNNMTFYMILSPVTKHCYF